MKDIKEKNTEDLQKLVSEKREEIRTFRFDIAGSKKKAAHTVRSAKKDIARALTELRARTTV